MRPSTPATLAATYRNTPRGQRASIRATASRRNIAKSTLCDHLHSKMTPHKQHTALWRADILKCIDHYMKGEDFPLEVRRLSRRSIPRRGRITPEVILHRLRYLYNKRRPVPPLPSLCTVGRWLAQYKKEHGQFPTVPRGCRSVKEIEEDRTRLDKLLACRAKRR